jgi:hypothetical protein
MTNHLPNVILPPKITTLEQVPGALEQVADYINAIPSTINSLSLDPAPEAASALQAAVVEQLSKHALTSLNEAKDGTYSPPDLEQPKGDSEPPKSPELLRALGAIASVAGFVQSAHEVDFSNTVDPDRHRTNEAQSRFNKVMEMLETNAPSLSLESGLENPEYASTEWFTEFLADHPELDDLHDIGAQILKVYALVGADEYKKAFAAIDEIEVLDDYDKAGAKMDAIVKIASGSILTKDEAFAIIDKICGMADYRKARGKSDVVRAKLSIVGDREKMAKALELGFSNR